MSSGLLAESKALFGTEDLYAVLVIDKTASKSQVKKAYYALSLDVHPDRVHKEEEAAATKKFQVLGKIYSILSDDEKRACYDETGSVDDEICGDENRDWSNYWRLIFPRVKEADLNEFQAKYQYSEEERNDLKKAYLDHEGDMDSIMDSIMCATVQDEPRFREILEAMIENGEITSYDTFTNEKPTKSAARKRKADKERKELEDDEREKAKKASAVPSSLEAMILSRQNARGNQSEDFFSHLEQKYGAKKSRKPASGDETKKKGASPARKSRKK